MPDDAKSLERSKPIHPGASPGRPAGVNSIARTNDLSQSDEIDLFGILSVLVRHRWVLLGVTFIFTLIAVAAAYLMTPVYRAQLVMAPVKADEGKAGVLSQLGGLASLAGISLGGGGTDKATALATLESQSFTREFIERHDLMPKLFAQFWNSKKESWIVDLPGGIPTLSDGAKVLADIRSVEEDKVTGLVAVAVEWTDPEQAAEWANLLVSDLNSKLRQAAIQEAERSIEYLTMEANKSNVVELQSAIYGLIEEQVKQIMLANVRMEFAFKVVDPALAPQHDDFVKPKRNLMIAIGIVVGVLVGAFSAFLIEGWRSRQSVG